MLSTEESGHITKESHFTKLLAIKAVRFEGGLEERRATAT